MCVCEQSALFIPRAVANLTQPDFLILKMEYTYENMSKCEYHTMTVSTTWCMTVSTTQWLYEYHTMTEYHMMHDYEISHLLVYMLYYMLG